MQQTLKDISTWKELQSVNYLIHQDEKAQVHLQAHLTEAHRMHARHAVAKDVILPAACEHKAETIARRTMREGKPLLRKPTAQFSGFAQSDDGAEGESLGLIAIIGEVMALQAKSNSNFWTTLWKQASQSMMMEVKFAPIIGDSVNAAYQAQSAGTAAQASQSREDGAAYLIGYSVTILAASYMEFKGGTDADPSAVPTQQAGTVMDQTQEAEQETATSEKQAEEANKDQAAGVGEDQTGPNEAEAIKDEKAINDAINNEEPNWEARRKRAWETFKDSSAKGKKRLQGVLGRALQGSIMTEGLLKGTTGCFIDSKYQSEQAVQQGKEGQAQALSKEAEQYTQFYSQLFSRTDTLNQGTQQNLDNAMNILKSAADSLTQVITSMFRG